MRTAITLVVSRHRVGVAVLGFDDKGRILMLKHVFHPDTPWGLPGGWLERNELPADCALRELREETGLTADLGPIIHIARKRKPNHMILTYAACIKASDVTLGPEILKSGWFHPEMLPQRLDRHANDALMMFRAREMHWIGQECP